MVLELKFEPENKTCFFSDKMLMQLSISYTVRNVRYRMLEFHLGVDFVSPPPPHPPPL
jgi:hypothetical protein